MRPRHVHRHAELRHIITLYPSHSYSHVHSGKQREQEEAENTIHHDTRKRFRERTGKEKEERKYIVESPKKLSLFLFVQI
jgi:hypothetical protein